MVITESQVRRLCLRVRCAISHLEWIPDLNTQNTIMLTFSYAPNSKMCNERMTSCEFFLLCALQPLAQAVHAWSVSLVQTCPRCPDATTRIESSYMSVSVHDGGLYKYAAMVLISWFYPIRTTQHHINETSLITSICCLSCCLSLSSFSAIHWV